MESIVADMITWTKGVSVKLTDFTVGSKVRTIYEAVAIVLEEQTDKLYRYMKELIETNVYAVFGFDKTPAVYATGVATFSRSTAATGTYYIAAGTTLTSKASQYSSPIKFYTTAAAVIEIGATSVDVAVICAVAGTAGNIYANTLTTFIMQPTGVERVTNASAFINGAEEETSDKQKTRFQEFMEAQSRGVLQSIAYGAKKATVTNSSGTVIELVTQATATEDLVNKLCQVDLYIWNGVGTASAALITNVGTVLTGYYDSNGDPVYGYKPAGVKVNVYSAPMKTVKVKLALTPESWTTLAAIQATVEAEVTRYFSSLVLNQTAIQSAVEACVKNISGVSDIKLYMSIDSGVTYTMDNVTPSTNGIVVMNSPIVYV